MAAPKPCTVCNVLVRDGTSRCEKHPKQAWVQKANYKRVSGRRLQRQRVELFTREPLCRACMSIGFVTLAVIRDHIKPLAEGGTDEDDNVQPLCQDCSDVKTEAERKRGIAAPRGPRPPTHREGGVKSLGPLDRKPTG